VTYPAGALSVDAAVINGAFSQYGWIPQVRQSGSLFNPAMDSGGPQCTDIQVQPKNGTGPYTLTVRSTINSQFAFVTRDVQIAPTLHPPMNITWTSGAQNWTVSLVCEIQNLFSSSYHISSHGD